MTDDKYTFQKRIVTIFIAFLFVLLGAVFYFFVIDANPPIKINYPITISPNEVSSGDIVIMNVDFCKYTDVPSRLSTFWKRDDGLVWELKVSEVSIAKKGCGILSVPLSIPSDIPDGNWQRINIADYKVNPFVTRTVTWQSDFIKVK